MTGHDDQRTAPIFDEHERTRVMDDTTLGATDVTDTDTDTGEATDSWLHPVNTGHLVMGIAFAGILVVWGLFQSDAVNTADLRWLAPLPWVLAGAVGLAVATQANLRSRRRREAGT